MSEEKTLSETVAEKLRKIYDNTVLLYNGWANVIKDIVEGDCSNIIIPPGTEKIRDYAFYNCKGFTELVIPDSVTSIGAYAFYGCESLKTYDFRQCTSIPTLGENALLVGDGTRIIVPYDLYGEWSATEFWNYIESCLAAPDEANFKVYADAEHMKSVLDLGMGSEGVGNYEVQEENAVKYLRIYSKQGSQEAFAAIANVENIPTGQYLVFKYRSGLADGDKGVINDQIEIWANTTKAGSKDDYSVIPAERDGKWHVVALDIKTALETMGVYNRFTASNGEYTATKVRVDWFNCPGEKTIQTDKSYIDIAYVGMCSDITQALNADPNYTGAEWHAEELQGSIDNSRLNTSDQGMEYVNFTPEENEIIDLYKDQSILTNVGQYAAVLFKVSGNNPEKCSAKLLHRRTIGDYLIDDPKAEIKYKDNQAGKASKDGWFYGVGSFDNDSGRYNETVCRRLGLAFDTPGGCKVDIAFVKFFKSQDEADDFGKNYMEYYGLI